MHRLACLALCVLGTACKSKSSEPASPPASASSAAAPAKPRCASAGAGSFTIGDRPAEPTGDGGDELPLPFAVEIGSAVTHGDGYAVAALRAKAGGTGAVLALVARDAASGRVVELGRTFGDAEAPRLAARGDTLIAAVPDNDAGGGTIRLASIRGSDVTWGADIAQGNDESPVFDVELGAKRGLLVWDEWDKKAKHGALMITSFDPKELGAATRPRSVSPEGDDAESPRLAPRPGGFWLAWVSRQAPEKPKAKAKDAGEKQEDDPLVDLGRRWLRIAPLDENGALVSEPRDVTGRQTHVLVFDLAALPGGGALLAWRDDRTSPGVERGAVHLARVEPSGSVEALALEDEAVGAGTPALLVDGAPAKNAPPVWLALGSVTDASALVALGPDGRPKDALGTEPAIGTGEPLALSGGRLLLGQPRGLSVELSTLQCSAGPPPDGG